MERRQEIELRNQTDSLVYQTERVLAEQGAKLPDADRATIEEALREAREALNGADTARIRQAQENLTRAAQKLAEAASRQSASSDGDGRGPGSSGQTGNGSGDVVDAEFRDAGTGRS
jgi:molecular chaperone DnaK